MKGKWGAVGGVGLGAALMYLFDPDRGKQRRARLRDKAIHVLYAGRDTMDVASRNAANRARGLFARTRSLLTPGRVSDPILAERVRSRIGHVVAHPGSIDVVVQDGCVTLAGPVLAREAEGLLEAVARVRGVAGAVQNRLEIHEEADGVPGLQGGRAEGHSASAN